MCILDLDLDAYHWCGTVMDTCFSSFFPCPSYRSHTIGSTTIVPPKHESVNDMPVDQERARLSCVYFASSHASYLFVHIIFKLLEPMPRMASTRRG